MPELATRDEVERLKVRVEEAERQLAEHGCYKVEREAFRERDAYKAQSELRREALKNHHGFSDPQFCSEPPCAALSLSGEKG